MTKATLLFSTALLGLAFSTPSAVLAAQPASAVQAAETETDRINQWFDEKYEEELQFSPIEQTFIGR